MAVQLLPYQQQVNIPSAVSSVIAAFIGVRDAVSNSLSPRVCKTSKAKKSGKKGTKKAAAPVARGKSNTGQAVVAGLVRTLDEAPLAIRNEYARGLVAHGDRFEAGDVRAHATLAAVLVRLNSCLVDVISRLLHQPQNSAISTTPIDYSQLSILCEASRIETCQSLAQLRQRLAQSLVPIPVMPLHKANSKTPVKTKSATKKKAASGQTVRPKPNASNDIHFPMLRTRPAPGRKTSRSSTSSDGSRTLVGSPTPSLMPASPVASPPGSPMMTVVKPQKATTPRSPPTAVSPSRAKATKKGSQPTMKKSLPSSPQLTQPLKPQTRAMTAPHLFAPPELQQTATTQAVTGLNRSHTIKSFASASTRLGEVPMHKWAVQPDWDEMSRINARAGYGVSRQMDSMATAAPGKQLRAGLLARLFRRSPMASVNE